MGTCTPEETDLPVFQYLDHTTYSPDLVPSDCHLFCGLKIKDCHLLADAEAIVASEIWLNGQLRNFLSGLEMLEEPPKKCTGLRGENVE
jgi:hypothetical protein